MIGSFRLPINITSSGDTTAPTILTAKVEDANPNKLVVVFSEVVDITDITGLTITGDATPTLSAPTGSGTNTITFTLSTALTNGQSVTLNVASSNTIEDAANNSLAATTQAIINNVAASSTVDADYQAVLDYATTNAIALPDASQQSIDNQILIDYKATGAWVKDDAFMKFTGTATPAFKLIDWKRLITMVAYGSLTWSDTGAKGNAANAYIDPLYVAATNGVNWKANDAGIVVGINQLNTIDSAILGYNTIGNQKTRVFAFGGTRLDHWQLNNNTRIESKAITGLSGLYIDTTQQTLIKDSSESIPSSTQYLPQDSLYLLCYNDYGTAASFTDAELSFVTFGADKRAEHAAMKTVLE